MKNYWIILFLSAAIFGCKESAGPAVPTLQSLLSKAQSDPSGENVNAYFMEVNKTITNKDNAGSIQATLQEAADFAVEKNQALSATNYLYPLVKSYPGPKSESNLLNLATMMHKSNKSDAAGILYQGYRESYPNAPAIAEMDGLITGDEPLHNHMDKVFNTVFSDPDEYGLNKKNALTFVDMAEAYALSKPNDNSAPEYLYKAAEIARSIRTIPKALTIYDWILEKYPNFDKSATVLFLKGFILENDVKDPQSAKTIYQEFMAKYPDHELSSSVKFLIDNIGKSDAEILEFLEKTGQKEG